MSVVTDSVSQLSKKENIVKDSKSPRSSRTSTPTEPLRPSGSSNQPKQYNSFPQTPSKQTHVTFPRPQPGQSSAPISKHSLHKADMVARMMQQQMAQIMKCVRQFLPDTHRGQTWMYAAAYVAIYTLIMLFRMSTFGFICIILYTALITMLALRFYGHGPLADHNAGRLR